MSDKPNPGSDEAQEQGCLCPVLDNGYGRGYRCLPGIFVMREDCPLHGAQVSGFQAEEHQRKEKSP